LVRDLSSFDQDWKSHSPASQCRGRKDLVGGYRIILRSRLLGGFRFKGNGGRGRRRGRSHCKRWKNRVRCGC
jgi:hypothetical protein